MSTLTLIWDPRKTYKLWASGNVHITAQVIRRIQNRVFLAHLGSAGAELTQVVAIKIARGLQELAAIETEHEFYERDLKGLQGTVVPQLHGFFRGNIDGIDIACMLLEYCSGPARRDVTELK
jgi:hypothetical protein